MFFLYYFINFVKSHVSAKASLMIFLPEGIAFLESCSSLCAAKKSLSEFSSAEFTNPCNLNTKIRVLHTVSSMPVCGAMRSLQVSALVMSNVVVGVCPFSML